VIWWAVPAAYLVFFVVLVYRYHRRLPHLSAYTPRVTGPLVSVIIPARDEALNIEPCVRSVLATAYQPIEVIVVDDRSRDETATIVDRIAREPASGGRLTLLRGAELPADWFGKQWALIQGYRRAQGDLLLFADADTRHTPELIPRAVAALGAEQVDLVTVLSRQEMVSFWERLVQPHVLLALAARVGDLRRVNRTRVPWNAIANGQFILTPRAPYEAVGTHDAVKHSVVEDLALAQAYVRHGRDIFLVHGAEYMVTRMYSSLAGIVAGWSKNLATGVPLMLPPVPWLRRVAPWLMWLPSLVWIAPAAVWLTTGASAALAVVLISLFVWLEIYWQEKAPLGYALLFPFGAVVVAFIMLRSAWRGRRKIAWKGRIYSAP
jgi:chlorobactene glucosyltransferase